MMDFILINSIKEQQQKIEEKDEAIKSLQSAAGSLQNDNAELKSRLDKFENALSQCCMSYKSQSAGAQLPNYLITDLPKLEQNIPNPFSENTIIRYYIPQNTGNGVIKIYSLDGSELKSISVSTKGFGNVEISGKILSAGTYTYMLLLDGKVVDTKQMVLTK